MIIFLDICEALRKFKHLKIALFFIKHRFELATGDPFGYVLCSLLHFSSNLLFQIQSTSLVLYIYQVWCFCDQYHGGKGPPKFIENSNFFNGPTVCGFETHFDGMIAILNRMFFD